MKKILIAISLLTVVPLLSGCTKKNEEKTLNPFSPSSMVDTYETSKGKINDSVQKQNEATTKALEESGINE